MSFNFLIFKIYKKMKKIILLIFVFSLTFISCNGQKNENGKGFNTNPKPETNISVKKKYDENGNLVSVDSTYSYVYSNIKNDSALKNKILKKFRNEMKGKMPFINDNFFNDILSKKDSLFDDFYTNDFFKNHLKNEDEVIKKMFKKMDSLKNEFFEKQKTKLQKNKS